MRFIQDTLGRIQKEGKGEGEEKKQQEEESNGIATSYNSVAGVLQQLLHAAMEARYESSIRIRFRFFEKLR